MTIIDFQKAKEDREPALQGEARCRNCEHLWQAVAPVGTRWLECPSCHTYLATWVGPFDPEERYRCNCGNDLLVAVPEGLRCRACGAWANPWPT